MIADGLAVLTDRQDVHSAGAELEMFMGVVVLTDPAVALGEIEVQ